MVLKMARCCSLPSCGKTQSLHCLSSDPSIRKEWISFFFYEVPDHVSKNLVLCSLNFTTDLFTNKAQFNTGLSERLKLRQWCAIYIGSDSNVAPHDITVKCE